MMRQLVFLVVVVLIIGATLVVSQNCPTSSVLESFADGKSPSSTITVAASGGE